MDDIVRQAMAKWPNVPHCYGWLGLDARGNWFMRDDRSQACGPFPTLLQPGSPAARGSLLRHDKLIAFIERNYGQDDTGQWFFQNGPQRVYLELEAAPWVWRLTSDDRDGSCRVTTHTGLETQALACLVDEAGRVYLLTDLGLGLVHTQDVALAAEQVESGAWKPETVAAADLPARFGFVSSPQARQQATQVAAAGPE